MRTWQAEATEAGERLQHLATPLRDVVKKRIAGAIDEAQSSLVNARESAAEALAGKPLRWIFIALAAGVLVGAALAYRRATWRGGHWTE